ncbi:MAG: hypothetical protein KJ709_05820 [Nanoarchaeota archaeon]|nr:hypothetical protein [Nanoarchaeota archaeon]
MQDIKKDPSFEIVRLGLRELQNKYGLQPEEILHQLSPKDEIPISVFKNPKLGILEVLVKYLKEERRMRLSTIAAELNRDQRTIWSTYANSKRKHPIRLPKRPSKHSIPLALFKDRKRSALSVLVLFLQGQGLSHKQTAIALGRSYPTVYAASRRGKR